MIHQLLMFILTLVWKWIAVTFSDLADKYLTEIPPLTDSSLGNVKTAKKLNDIS